MLPAVTTTWPTLQPVPCCSATAKKPQMRMGTIDLPHGRVTWHDEEPEHSRIR